MEQDVPDSRRRMAGFAAHFLTASGAALGLLALNAAADARWTAMFVWLAAALIVDAIDGPLARAVNVRKALPRYDGTVLDLVVDYLNYVVVPAFALVTSGLLPQAFSLPAGCLIAVTSALYFADTRMKTADNYFLGFPGIWNVVAFYLFLLPPPQSLAAAVVTGFALMSFLPVPFVHPFRVKRLRKLNAVLLGLGVLLLAHALWHDLAPPLWERLACLGIGLWFLGAGIFRRPSLQVLK